ncbi:unnamed protein product [Cylindrotheca closterium]|uniref:Uncharacterized protein n=1 Tax=Cylindrotheca closterium TaxID=2856 RepID=A0AAD2GBP8_9STRA|nr:unnamed protein product [Cylindrotheca closterium]
MGPTLNFASLCHVLETEAGSNGDPHFKTWHNEHFASHDTGVTSRVPSFIRIGNAILEIEGSALEFDSVTHYWINYEYQGELTEFAGFPVKMFSQQGTAITKNRIEIDFEFYLSRTDKRLFFLPIRSLSRFLSRMQMKNRLETSVVMLGDFNTGQTLARDGVTVLDDFTELGHEWQVLRIPSGKHLFRVKRLHLKFPETCIDPEYPRGDRRRCRCRRRRRLDCPFVSEEEAEAACYGLKDELDRKDCAVYDILATPTKNGHGLSLPTDWLGSRRDICRFPLSRFE